jgi:hypothetical protein
VMRAMWQTSVGVATWKSTLGLGRKDTSAEPAVTVWLAKTNAQSLQVACRDAAQDEEFRTWLRSYLLDPEGTYSDEALWQMHNAKGLRCNQPPYPKSPTASSGSVVVPPP